MASEPKVLTYEAEVANSSTAAVEFQEAKTCCGDFMQNSQNSQVANSNLPEKTNQKLNRNADFSELSVISEKSEISELSHTSKTPDESDGHNSYVANRNVAEGLMDIALLSANANQLRFLITYNNAASTYYISLGLIALSLTLQVAVGIALIFKRRMKRRRDKRLTRTNEFLIGGVFMVTVVNILLAAFTTTDGKN